MREIPIARRARRLVRAGPASTLTVMVSSRSSRRSSITKCGASRSSLRISSSICVGNTLTPRTIIMSSERPVIFSMRRIERAVPGNSRVRSRVR